MKHELMHLISGAVILTDTDGESIQSWILAHSSSRKGPNCHGKTVELF
ncbi:hypothetical protein GGD50_006662 [Rhizobium paranaense]|uniref:Uncharacterized protein n=1 Tax=Rhizobium paranaense TaxID=1650438 RepID=A0A7W8XYP1_9HYPH|nr:hypothetical protein [Rhizobium paranaense]